MFCDEEILVCEEGVRSHFGSSAAPSLSGRRGACELIGEDYPQAATSGLPLCAPILLATLMFYLYKFSRCVLNRQCDLFCVVK